MEILITGGTGFVGGALVEELIKDAQNLGIKKKDVYVLVREDSNIDHLNKLGVKFIVGDLTNYYSLKEAVKNKSIIFHLCSVVLDQSPQDILYKVNVLGTKTLIDLFAHEKTAQKFVFISTWGVLGYNVKNQPMKENLPFNPTNDYHKSKADAENIVWEYAKNYKLPVVVARLPMILGPGDTLTTPRVIQAFYDKKVKIIGKGNNLFSIVHVQDAARAILILGFKKEAFGKVYNIKSFDISQKDYWFEHKKILNIDDKIPSLPKILALFYALLQEMKAKRKGKKKSTLTRHRVMRYGNTRILDVSRIKKELHWEPIHTNGKQVIKDTIKWLDENNFIDHENKKVLLIRKWEEQ